MTVRSTAPLVRPGPNRARPGGGPTLVLFAVLLLAGLPLAACGKKGPPLPPFVRVPAASENLSARRLGDTVYLQLVVPSRNQDNSTPADLTRIGVYGYTGAPATDDEIVKYGTLVGTIQVRKPLTEDERAKRQQAADRKEPIREEPGVDQGATVTLSETLTPALLQPVVLPASKKPAPTLAGAAGAAEAVSRAVVARVYTAIGFNHRGRRGVFSRRAAVAIAPLPPPPASLKLTYTETQINLAWTAVREQPPAAAAAANASGGVAGETAAASSSAAAPLRYNVYAVPSAASQAPQQAATGTPEVPTPLNDKPLADPAFADSRLEFGTERCYVVRTVVTVGEAEAESQPSEMACVTPKDVFPPAAPKGLTAVTSAGAINLLWEPNAEADLGGYLVLRGEAPDGTLQPITGQPIRETTFNDTTVKAGVRYVYAVVAVDKSGNIGAQSNKVEETAR